MKDTNTTSYSTSSKIANSIQNWLDKNNKKFFLLVFFYV